MNNDVGQLFLFYHLINIVSYFKCLYNICTPLYLSIQTIICDEDIKAYSDEDLKDAKKLRRYLFMQLVEEKTWHYTGLISTKLLSYLNPFCPV